MRKGDDFGVALFRGAFAFSFLLTMAYRSFALRFALFDVPNFRSSHSVPTPRGGGLAIALTVLCVAPSGFGVTVTSCRQSGERFS